MNEQLTSARIAWKFNGSTGSLVCLKVEAKSPKIKDKAASSAKWEQKEGSMSLEDVVTLTSNMWIKWTSVEAKVFLMESIIL